MKMTRAEKRRRRTAKEVEMKLDGMTDVDQCKHLSFEDLHRYHAQWKKRRPDIDYYGASLADKVINEAGERMRREIDKQILKEYMDGKSISTD